MSGYKSSSGAPVSFQEFPKWMHRKDGKSSLVVNSQSEQDDLGDDWQENSPGRPEMTKLQAVQSAAEAPAFAEFPKWKHASGNRSCIVESQAEEDALDGFWFDKKKDADEFTEPEVAGSIADISILGDPVVAKRYSEAEEKNALADEAVRLGVRVHKMWGLPRLRKEVEAARDNG